MRANSKAIDKAKVLDNLDESLTNNSKVAASLGDEFLVYLIDMAVSHVREKAIHLEVGAELQLQALSSKPASNIEFAQWNVSSLMSGIRPVSECQLNAVQ